MDERFIARFWRKVDKRGDEPEHCPGIGECWNWIASLDRTGYGRFGLGAASLGWAAAHRVSWQIANGQMPAPPLFVLHKCDNRRCVRPDHLFLGAAADNTSDMIAKGRARKGRPARGERNGKAKLTESQVRELLELYSERRRGDVQRIAERFGVTRMTVFRVATGRRHSAA